AETAWTYGDAAGQVVAVVDTGVDGTHPDLAGTLVPGFDAATVGGSATVDLHGHGTHVAGIAAAVVDNGVGVAGLGRRAAIMPVRVLDADGLGTSDDVAEGIVWAVDHGADVVNLSLGGTERSTVIASAVRYAGANDVVVVAAAGNEGDAGNPVTYPAAEPGVVAVAAVDRGDVHPTFSGSGDWVDIAAPGVDIVSTVPGGYASSSGTSMAAPFVAATAALVRARHSQLDAEQVAAHLLATADDIGATGTDPLFGAGVVDPVAALSEPEPACPADVPSAGFTDVAGNRHEAAIDCVVWRGVARGATARTYAPALQVTRGQMASLLANVVEQAGVTLPPASDQGFDDLGGSVHADRVNQLAAAGLVAGVTRDEYRPGAVVSRAQMATFLVRAVELVEDAGMTAGRDAFDDDDGNVHEPSIDKLAAAGIASGSGNRTYLPSAGVRRDQMASFLARVLERFAAGDRLR
ncbi:MAG: S8 family serine peptidase, partial [Actinomycetota bacterium]|nr:S8 family serine peptidase [Actinomycetota bacterium]